MSVNVALEQFRNTNIHRCTFHDDGRMEVDERYIVRALTSYFEKSKAMSKDVIRDEVNGTIVFPYQLLADNFNSFVKFVVNTPEIGDFDVSSFVNDMMKFLNYKFTIEEGKKFLSLGEYYLYLLSANDEFYISRDGSVVKLDKKYDSTLSIESGMFGRFLTITGSIYALCNDQIIGSRKMMRIGDGKFDIENLPMRPINDDERQAVLEYNRNIYDTYKPSMYLNYEGVAYSCGYEAVVEHYINNRRVMVDNAGLKETDLNQLNELFAHVIGAELLFDRKGDMVTTPSDETLLTLCRHFAMFDLHGKKWILGHWDNLSPLEVREDAFDRLILDSQTKEMIRAISVMHKIENADIVNEKCSNAVFLLHGKPGTGKTLTAEAVSELLRKPLYKVSLGELGTVVDTLESSLDAILTLAERWDAIVLIDEADVFLEARDTDNLERNAMVAVFLRLLEYYSGILFLTTNRAKTFDDAFVSRITLAVQYESPDRRSLWEMLLQNSGIMLADHEFEELISYDVNGRQVKSSINAAKSYAKYQQTEVTCDMIKMFLDRSTMFAKYIRE